VGAIILVLLFCAVFLSSFSLGRYEVTPWDTIRILGFATAEAFCNLAAQASALLGSLGMSFAAPQFVWPADIDSSAATTVMQVRFPRVLVAVCVGAALSLAGAAYQGMFQNPMVSQDILGASSGAGFGASLAILLGLGAAGVTTLGFVMGLLAVAIAYLISRASNLGSILAMILAGMVVSALFSAATSYVKLVADTEDALPAITYWLMGSLSSIRLGDLWVCLLLLAAGVPLFILRWRINILSTGEEEARSLGVNVAAVRVAVIGCATLLTAGCVAVSGVIGWVGLIIPHFCRLIFGYDYRRIVPASLLLGATFLLAVDDLARVATTSEIPLGILTAVVGAPLFIFLMLRGGLRNGRR
jgi:iron complex transport system permease protein